MPHLAVGSRKRSFDHKEETLSPEHKKSKLTPQHGAPSGKENSGAVKTEVKVCIGSLLRHSRRTVGMAFSAHFQNHKPQLHNSQVRPTYFEKKVSNFRELH